MSAVAAVPSGSRFTTGSGTRSASAFPPPPPPPVAAPATPR